MEKAWFTVVDVLHFDDELRLGLQQTVGGSIPGLGPERVEGFLFSVQAFRGVDVTCQLVNQEDGPCTFARDGVLDGPVAFVRIRVDLGRREEEGRMDTYRGRQFLL